MTANPANRASQGGFRLGLAAKLFLTLLSAIAVTVVAMSLAARVSFVNGFLGYLNDQET